MKKILQFSIVAILLISLGGCSQPENGDEATERSNVTVASALKNARDKGYETQVKLLEDGQVTRDDYKTAFNDYTSCLEGHGFKIVETVINPTDNQRLIATVDTGNNGYNNFPGDTESSCNLRYLADVEVAYSISTEPFIDPSVLRETFKCLEKNGIEYSGRETKAEDFYPKGTENDSSRDLSITQCVGAATLELYPDLPYVAFGY